MTEIIAAVLMLAGTAFMSIAAIGLIRLPDLYTRMHAITKAGTLGIGLLLVGVAVYMGDLSFTTRAIVVIVFVLLTAPVSAHMIGRAGYLGGVSMWRGTVVDQWRHTFRDVVEEQGRMTVRSASTEEDVPVHRSDALHEGDRRALFSDIDTEEPAGSASASESTEASDSESTEASASEAKEGPA